MSIALNMPLAELTTFGVGGPAMEVVTVTCRDQVPSTLAYAERRGLSWLILGEGSNVVASDEGFAGVVLRMAMRGVEQSARDEEHVCVTAAAGESWDGFVAAMIERGLYGIENMSGIPGSIGAVPVQNVGAYGQDASQVVDHVVVWDVVEHAERVLSNAECQFGYRSSVFNARGAGSRFIILAVCFRLRRKWQRVLRHGALSAWAERHPVEDGRAMRDAVLSVRNDGRLPDPDAQGNAGSFFKAVTLSEAAVEALAQRVPASAAELPDVLDGLHRTHRVEGGIRVPAGVLMRCAGVTGWREGGAAQHERNPTILVNSDGHATGRDVVTLARRIIEATYAGTGVRLCVEPRLVGFTPSAIAGLYGGGRDDE